MGSWVHGFMCSWVHGSRLIHDASRTAHGAIMCSWVHVFISSRLKAHPRRMTHGPWQKHGLMGSCVHGFMAQGSSMTHDAWPMVQAWAHGFMCSWVHGSNCLKTNKQRTHLEMHQDELHVQLMFHEQGVATWETRPTSVCSHLDLRKCGINI